MVDSEEKMNAILEEFDLIGGKWKSFGAWLKKNKAAMILWFTAFYKGQYGSLGNMGVRQ